MQKFNYHTHTRRCGHADNNMTDEDFVKLFIKKGFTKIAFTDHCPEKEEIDHRANMRMKYFEKDEYINSIKSLKERYKDKIEIETGFEIEYLPGQEENLFELKKETDKLILGQHFIYDENNNLIETLVTDKVGIATSQDLYKGKYYLKELETGSNYYLLNEDTFEFEIAKNGETIKKTIKNEPTDITVDVDNTGTTEIKPGEDVNYEFK